MGKAHQLFLIGTNKILAGLLTILGFSVTSCSPEDEYGSPYATYEIKGKVVNEQGVAIPGIQVVTPAPKANVDETGMLRDTLITDQQGQFNIQTDLGTFGGDVTFRIKSEDIDGEANGGLFEEAITEIPFKGEDLKGKSGSWYFGHAEKEVTITLKKGAD